MSSTKKILFHGSFKKGLKFLLPATFSGSNGSQDGIGINLTNALPLAVDYAGGDGSIYASAVDVSEYLPINEKHYLNQQQTAILENFFNNKVPNDIKVRLATEFSGRLESVFDYDDEKEALAFYKLAKESCPELPDRLKPHVEFEKEHISVFTPHDNISLKGVNTHKIHYSLNLIDNGLATDSLSLISKGLIIPKGGNLTNYLSFDASIAPSLAIPSKGISVDVVMEFVNSLVKLDDQEFLTLIESTKNEDDYFVDPATAYNTLSLSYNKKNSEYPSTSNRDNQPLNNKPIKKFIL